MNHIELGVAGENLAEHHLVAKGYEIVARNYRWKHAEIDIICRKNNQLVVVEVKTRNSNALGKPYEAVSIAKQRQVIRVANEYVNQYEIDDDVRFDIVSIVLNQNRMEVEHIEDAFYPLV